MTGRDELRLLAERSGNQGTAAEYELVWDTIREGAPGNVLVFGVGRDSRYWIEANEGGHTVFVEHEEEWVEETRRRVPGIEIVQVSYDTRRWWWWWLLKRPARLAVKGLPESVWSRDWDVIFVDGPQGHRWKQPGRMKSIYTASLLAGRSTDARVLVHDCDRTVERVYSDTYLTPARLTTQVDTLRLYRFGRE